tara:strand:+ start:281 stop:451 length:171 start_codon:yes stop_codon:yes gene_type:complete
MEEIKKGDYVQYRTASGVVVGYGIIVDITEHWHVLVDHHTSKREYWCNTLMRKIVP